MTDISQRIRQLKSPNKNARYEACEELRVANALPEEALSALEEAMRDPDPLVADAARRALLIHRPAQAAAPSSALPQLSASGSPPTTAHPLSPPAFQVTTPPVQMPSSAPTSPEYVFALEKRIMYLEVQVATLHQAVDNASKASEQLAARLPSTAIISPRFLPRAFAIWGHALVAGFIVTIVLYGTVFALVLAIGGLGSLLEYSR